MYNTLSSQFYTLLVQAVSIWNSLASLLFLSYVLDLIVPEKYKNTGDKSNRIARPLSKLLILFIFGLVFLIFFKINKDYLTAVTAFNSLLVSVLTPENVLRIFSNVDLSKNKDIKENIKRVFTFIKVTVYIANFDLIISIVNHPIDYTAKIELFCILFVISLLVFIISIAISKRYLSDKMKFWIN